MDSYDGAVGLGQGSGTGSPAAGTAGTPAAQVHGAEAGQHEAAEPGPAPSGILAPESVVLAGRATTRDTAIDEAGQLLLDRGAVDPGYLAAMHAREQSVSTYMGSYLAIPHGDNAAKGHIMKSAVSVVRYPDGIDWNGQEVRFVVGVAGINNEHLQILSSIAKVFTDPGQVDRLEEATTVQEILDLFGNINAR